LSGRRRREQAAFVSSAPIMLRASITADEWKLLRTLAIKRGVRTADLVADALRTAYLNGGPAK
jgi:hypothetical protein